MKIAINLGIIEGREKRALECYIDERLLRQRKDYDEYYVDVDVIDAEWNMSDLMILAEHFRVTVGTDNIYITDL